MNRTNIVFATPTAGTEGVSSPWNIPKQSTFEDLLLKPEFAVRKFRFPVGSTWLRIVPALYASRCWMLAAHALNYKGGRHTHIKTLTPGARSVFDVAYQWLKENKPESLFSKANRSGYHLLSDAVAVFSAIVEEQGKPVARLIVASAYDGSRGGMPGLGHRVWTLVNERDEEGNLVADPVDPAKGVKILIEKTQPSGAEYPVYTLRVGKVPAPIDELIAKMEPEEVAALRALEEVIEIPDTEKEWQLLERVIDPEMIRMIRASQA